MFKTYYLLVLVLCSQLESVSEKEYYQYVINAEASAPCVSTSDCFCNENEVHLIEEKGENAKENNKDINKIENAKENEHQGLPDSEYEEDETDDYFDEDMLYDEEIDVIPYDALNDALHEVNENNNRFKAKRSTGPYDPSEREYRKNQDGDYHKKMNGYFPGDDKLMTTNCLVSESHDGNVARKITCSEKNCKSNSNHFDNQDYIHSIEDSESEFYNDGVTRNDLLERKKLELIRHTFADEKMKLLQTDKFIHQIISSLGQLENYEFDNGENNNNDPQSDQLRFQSSTWVNDDDENDIDETVKDSFNERTTENQLLTEAQMEPTVPDSDDTKLYKESPEDLPDDFDDFKPNKLNKISPNFNRPNSYDGEIDNDTHGSILAKVSISEEIVDDPEVSQNLNSHEKFVISEKQYNSYLRSLKHERENEDQRAADPNVYEIKTKTTKPKRKVSNDLHDFEMPVFDKIPKVHQLSDIHVDRLWNDFKKKYKKHYSHARIDAKKKSHWQDNHRKIHQHNEEAQQGIHSYTLRDNHFSDLHSRHYVKEMARLTHSRIRRNLVRSPASNDSVLIPDHLDWRDRGFVTPDWNQEECGACYAFSIASAIQGQLFKTTSVIEDLSIQQVVDCSIISGNLGCAGGSLRNTLNYVQFAGGLMKEEDYPYKGKQSICKFKRPATVVDISSWSVLPPQDEHALKVTLATIGPVAVSINASPHTFQLYASGIYDDVACTSDFVNHAMLLVGYTRNSWILKNWWSDSWGDKGYMYLKRGSNRCGIANYAVYALI